MKLNIICALQAEAKPIIEAYRLKRDLNYQNFQIYQNTNDSILLIISGIGEINSAIATTVLGNIAFQTSSKERQAFLNVGIAGAKNFKIGDLYLVNKLSKEQTLKNYYPKNHLHSKFPATELITHNNAVIELLNDCMVDMEAFGFYQASLNYTQQEFIQIAKIISDNSLNDQNAITKESVIELIDKQKQQWQKLISNMFDLDDTLRNQNENLCEELKEKFKLSTFEKNRLQDQLHKLQVFEVNIHELLIAANKKEQLFKQLDEKIKENY